jgi:hypothetical protein
MSEWIIGIGRYLLITCGSLTLIFVYCIVCGVIYKRFPRIGLALLGIVVAAFFTFFSFVGITIVGMTNGRGLPLLVPIYAVVLIGWWVFVFKQSDGKSK